MEWILPMDRWFTMQFAFDAAERQVRLVCKVLEEDIRARPRERGTAPDARDVALRGSYEVLIWLLASLDPNEKTFKKGMSPILQERLNAVYGERVSQDKGRWSIIGKSKWAALTPGASFKHRRARPRSKSKWVAAPAESPTDEAPASPDEAPAPEPAPLPPPVPGEVAAPAPPLPAVPDADEAPASHDLGSDSEATLVMAGADDPAAADPDEMEPDLLLLHDAPRAKKPRQQQEPDGTGGSGVWDPWNLQCLADALHEDGSISI